MLRRHAHLRLVSIPRLPLSAVRLRRLFDRLAPVIGLSPRLIDERVIAGIAALPYAPVTIKTDAGRGRADGARRAPERIPRRRPAAGLDPRLPLRRDGGAGARLCRPGHRRKLKLHPFRGRQAGDRGRPGRPGVLLRPLPARQIPECGACRSTRPAKPSPRLLPVTPQGRAQPQAFARPGPRAGG